jgi:undecaprenyl-diphosphatase
LGRSLRDREINPNDTYAKVGWLLVVATVPAGILGVLFQDSVSRLLALPKVAASLLIVNGFILLGAESLRKRSFDKRESIAKSDTNISKLKWGHSLGIGIFQSAALLPGISRSGSSMAGSLVAGLNNEDAARFSFLLATPVILGAAILKLPSLFSSSAASIRGAMLVGAISAGLAAFISVRFLVKYFKTKTLTPFALYCLIGGALYLGYFLAK